MQRANTGRQARWQLNATLGPMKSDPFNGMWKLNVAASTIPFAPPRSVILQIEAGEHLVRFTENSISAEGVPEAVTIEAKPDNESCPVIGSAIADGFAIDRIDAHTWKTRGFKAGETVFTATLVMSADGQSFREDGETTLTGGARAGVSLVYERCDI